jgi:hypothetical protein
MTNPTSSQKILKYLQDNADRVITLDEFEEKLEMSRNGISSSLSLLVSEYPEHLMRRRQGQFIWSANKRLVSANGKPSVVFEVVTSDELDNFLGKNVSTGELYVCKKFEF